jgi:hypothetical protein
MTTYKIVWEVGAVIIVVATIALWINPKLAK